MSFSVGPGPSYATAGAWTPDQDSVVSGFTDASLYASLQRHPQYSQQSQYQYHQQQQQQQQQYQHQQARQKASFVSLRNVNARPLHKRGRRVSEMTAGAGGDGGMGGEVIEVQILPQDDNWGDNTTAITGNTSVRSESFQDVTIIGRDQETGVTFTCQRYAGSALCALVALFAFLSPIAMVLIPRLNVIQLKSEHLKCDSECDGLLISFSFKLLILLLGSWALFFRQPKATMPRIFIFRALVTMLIFVFTFSYWLFYVVRILENRDEVRYRSIVYFAVSLVDALLFIQYLAVILLELRHLTPQYMVKVLRSPDGESRWYNIGQLSVQRAAAWVLEKYYQDFTIYNPYLDRVPSKKKPHPSNSSFKYYDVDGNEENPESHTRAMLTASARRRDSAHNERFYEEHEYERRVRKRKARLITAAEEAFTHIKRMHDDQGQSTPMNPHEAAQSIFPSLARALQKYLRITRQQPRHTMDSILSHLAICLAHDMSPRAFLEKYLVSSPVMQNDKEHRGVQSWGLVCDQLLSRPINGGTIFQLRQADVCLLCSISHIPHFSIAEEIIHPKSNKFVLRLNSETSV
ncbi:vang-like protein 1 [Portunus trituberculatus]|uniref:vang-like protein 1 n=1 Tax=Portunus trituberculatus TaxID=210409 RepID=UPI001E1CF1C4|nr:vang-like protein 1 [Portunus trituberculatus]XP_045130017.1 vang-like protein 1 [Portunus trituberculatus]